MRGRSPIPSGFPPARWVPLLLAGFLLLPALAAAQGTPTPSLRPYWHVFAAYAIAWALVLAWVVSITRRLARLERKLRD